MSLTKRIIFTLAFLFSVIYLAWRGLFTLPFHQAWWVLVFGVLLWLCEVVSTFTGMILIYNKQKAKKLSKPQADEKDYPDVDVLIATHNEEVALLRKTVNACVKMKYPDKHKVHIYLCDDSNRPEVKALAEEFGITHIGMTENKQAKSGNLNHALSQTTSPLVATFDADMIPYSNFLLETVPFFVENQNTRNQDEKTKPLGLVQTPQSFYNADLFQFNLFVEQNVANEQDFFSREINILNNAHGAAIYTGSNTVLSREAIMQAGGFPTDTITEDFELGARMNIAGYQNLSTLSPMASGLTPVDIPSMIKQRVRWAQGVVQSVRNIHLITNKNLSFGQKIVYLNSYLYWWSFLRRLVFILAPICYTLLGWEVVDTNFWTLLYFWIPCQIFQKLALKEVASKVSTPRWGEIQETILAPFLTIPVFKQWIGLGEHRFKVTDKNAKASKKDILYGWPHFLLWLFAFIGLIRFNLYKTPTELFYGSVISFWLLSHLFNLTFALLFFVGRPSYRSYERFKTSYPLQFMLNGQLYQTQTHDISEAGLSFMNEEMLNVPLNQKMVFTLMRDHQPLTLMGEVVRVVPLRNQYLFGVHLDLTNKSQYHEYLSYIYDGFNQNLPQYYDHQISLFRRFVNIFYQRTRLVQTKMTREEAQLKVPIFQQIHTADGTLTLQYLIAKHLIIQAESLLFAPKLNISYQGIDFQLSLVRALSQDTFVYHIDNWQEVLHHANYRQLFSTRNS